MKNKEECLVDLIDYLLKDYCGDACGKCAYYSETEEFQCKGNCRQGMIEYFVNMCNTHKDNE